MPTQEERRAATTTAILAAARERFAAAGFDATSIDDVATAAGVTKGAVYHYFDTKEAIFRAVFEAMEEELVGIVVAAVADADDPVDALRTGARAFLGACRDPEVRQVTLLDGPTVLGWETWRQLDEQYFRTLVETAVAAAVGDPGRATTLTHLFVGAMDEGALFIARADDPDAAMEDVVAEIDRLIAAVV